MTRPRATPKSPTPGPCSTGPCLSSPRPLTPDPCPSSPQPLTPDPCSPGRRPHGGRGRPHRAVERVEERRPQKRPRPLPAVPLDVRRGAAEPLGFVRHPGLAPVGRERQRARPPWGRLWAGCPVPRGAQGGAGTGCGAPARGAGGGGLAAGSGGGGVASGEGVSEAVRRAMLLCTNPRATQRPAQQEGRVAAPGERFRGPHKRPRGMRKSQCFQICSL